VAPLFIVVTVCVQYKCARYWPETSDKVYHNVPDNSQVEGRIGVRVVSSNKEKNFTISEFELTREDLQVSWCTMQSRLGIIMSLAVSVTCTTQYISK